MPADVIMYIAFHWRSLRPGDPHNAMRSPGNYRITTSEFSGNTQMLPVVHRRAAVAACLLDIRLNTNIIGPVRCRARREGLLT